MGRAYNWVTQKGIERERLGIGRKTRVAVATNRSGWVVERRKHFEITTAQQIATPTAFCSRDFRWKAGHSEHTILL